LEIQSWGVQIAERFLVEASKGMTVNSRADCQFALHSPLRQMGLGDFFIVKRSGGTSLSVTGLRFLVDSSIFCNKVDSDAETNVTESIEMPKRPHDAS
jgi:hypothetical protein